LKKPERGGVLTSCAGMCAVLTTASWTFIVSSTTSAAACLRARERRGKVSDAGVERESGREGGRERGE
jgi:hypothetical protein